MFDLGQNQPRASECYKLLEDGRDTIQRFATGDSDRETIRKNDLNLNDIKNGLHMYEISTIHTFCGRV